MNVSLQFFRTHSIPARRRTRTLRSSCQALQSRVLIATSVYGGFWKNVVHSLVKADLGFYLSSSCFHPLFYCFRWFFNSPGNLWCVKVDSGPVVVSSCCREFSTARAGLFNNPNSLGTSDDVNVLVDALGSGTRCVFFEWFFCPNLIHLGSILNDRFASECVFQPLRRDTGVSLRDERAFLVLSYLFLRPPYP